MRVVLIHGRAQGGKNPNELKATWINTLQKGFAAASLPFPQDLVIEFPYYADTLDHFVGKFNLPTSSEIATKGTGENPQYSQFLASALLQLQDSAKVSDATVDGLLPPDAPRTKGIENWPWVRALAQAIDAHLSGVSSFTIEEFLRDVYLYVKFDAVSGVIDSIVQKALVQNQPTIVIAHSLGSVVGYNVLRHAAKGSLDLRKYVTVGCPLPPVPM